MNYELVLICDSQFLIKSPGLQPGLFLFCSIYCKEEANSCKKFSLYLVPASIAAQRSTSINQPLLRWEEVPSTPLGNQSRMATLGNQSRMATLGNRGETNPIKAGQ